MIYGVLELLGSSSRPEVTSKRKAQQFPLEASCLPPGTDAYDYFQFGRSASLKNTFVIFDRQYYLPNRRNINRVSRFAFRIQGCSDTLKVKLLGTVVNDQGECIPVKNVKIKKYNEIIWKDLNSDCTLESGTIIGTPGASFFWQDRKSICNLTNQLVQLNKTVHKKLLEGKFIASSIFHIDFRGDFYMLEPCHHILSIGSIAFWTNLGMPQYEGNDSCMTKCPFCETPIEDYPGYTLVIKQLSSGV